MIKINIVLLTTTILTVTLSEEGLSNPPAPPPPPQFANATEYYKSALTAFRALRRSLSLTISSNILEQNHIETMWYADYVRVREDTERTEYLGTHDPHLRLITVMQRGIYFKIFNRTWKDLDPRADENTLMNNLFEVPISNNITASKLERNSSVIAVAYQNLTVEIIDLKDIREKVDKEGKVSFDFPSRLIDTTYRYGKEEGDEILAIGHIPASDYLVFASNRFEILKIDRKSGKIVKVEKNPLDKIGMIEAPCLSHRANQDPFNPESAKNPEISPKNLNQAQKSTFIATGAEDPMNAVIDWTTMKAVRFFSMHLLFSCGVTRTDDIVGSITYFGAIPLGQFYIISKRGPTSSVIVHSEVQGRVVNEIETGINSRNKEVSWIYGTSYVSIFYPVPTSIKDGSLLNIYTLKFHYGSMKYQGFKTMKLRIYELTRVNKFEMVHLFLQKGKLESDPESWMFRYIEPDSLYLSVYNKTNTIRIEPPPIYWDFCLPNVNLKASTEMPVTYMLYGRMSSCPITESSKSPEGESLADQGQQDGPGQEQGLGQGSGGGGGDQPPQQGNQQQPEDSEYGYCSDGLIQMDSALLVAQIMINRTYSVCRAKKCLPGQIPHFVDQDVNLRNFKVSKGFHCYPPYPLDEKMKGFANNNGCWPRFNKNYFGVCQFCHSWSSDCLLFAASFSLTDRYTLPAYNYSYDTYNQTVPYKDYRLKTLNGWASYKDYMTSKTKNLALYPDFKFVWKFQKKSLSRECYSVEIDESDPFNYLVSTRAEYTLVKVGEAHPYNISQQKEEIFNGTLSEVMCIKGCRVGFFYEFESISCRKCNMGCGVCTSFQNCSECIPGFSEILPTEHHIDMQDDRPVGTCIAGCQPGFYARNYNGTCRECPHYCLRCRDKRVLELNRSLELNITNDIYCIQCRPKDDKGKPLYANLTTGECVTRCEGFGTFAKSQNSSDGGDSYLVCGKCFDPHCSNCNSSSAEKACIACESGYYLQTDGNCEDFWDTEDGQMAIILIIVGCFVLVIMLMVCFVCWAFQSRHQKVIKKFQNAANLIKSKKKKLFGMAVQKDLNKGKATGMDLADIAGAFSSRKRELGEDSFQGESSSRGSLMRKTVKKIQTQLEKGDLKELLEEEGEGGFGSGLGSLSLGVGKEEEGESAVNEDGLDMAMQSARMSMMATKRGYRVSNNNLGEFERGFGSGSGTRSGNVGSGSKEAVEGFEENE